MIIQVEALEALPMSPRLFPHPQRQQQQRPPCCNNDFTNMTAHMYIHPHHHAVCVCVYH